MERKSVRLRRLPSGFGWMNFLIPDLWIVSSSFIVSWVQCSYLDDHFNDVQYSYFAISSGDFFWDFSRVLRLPKVCWGPLRLLGLFGSGADILRPLNSDAMCRIRASKWGANSPLSFRLSIKRPGKFKVLSVYLNTLSLDVFEWQNPSISLQIQIELVVILWNCNSIMRVPISR